MGNSTSSNDEYEDQDQDDEQQQDNDNDEYAKQFDGIDTLGYRVLGVQPDSPASKAGLVSFFDFIVGANEKMLLGSGEHLIEGEEYDDIDFPLLLKEASESKTSVTLLVWNIKIQEKRIVQLYPNNDWGGAGLLGVTIKLDNYGGADERLVRVLEIMDDIDNDKSPAFLAGLQPMKDFLLGTTSTTLTSTDILSTILQCNINQIIELYVYNTTTDVVRIVTVHPTYNWGNGDSILGAVLGTGYLHRLPQSCRTTIGKSIERKVSINSNADNNKGNDNMNMNFSQDDIKIEPTLEMEIDDDYDDDDDDDDD
ncbi:GRASP55_65-domain-containing protein, partial [Fragilariopsis cylindrus CCMP1102]